MYSWICLSICASLIVLTLSEAPKFKFCPEEATNEKSPVVWPNSWTSSAKIISNPLCLTKSQELITRVCSENDSWMPKHDDVQECFSTQSRPAPIPCPPEYERIELDGALLFCYKLSPAHNWDYPCLKSGSSKTVYDLASDEIDLMKKRLVFKDRKLVWLPAKRIVPYGPIVWTTTGEKWGKPVEFDGNIKATRLPVVHNCLLLDLDRMMVKAENCSYQYPSLCIFRDKHVLPLHCSLGYGTSRYGLNGGRCYGMELEENESNWNEFLENRCQQPIQISNYLENYLFEEVSSYRDYDMSDLCWTSLFKNRIGYRWHPNVAATFLYWDSQTDFNSSLSVRGVINQKYRWLLIDENFKIRCMACQRKAIKKEVDMSLQFSGEVQKLFLTIYNPRSLWKQQIDHPGVQCFTNAEGFVKVAEIEDMPYRKLRFSLKDLIMEQIDRYISNNEVEKIVYEIETEDDEAGEYWCEGHDSINFQPIISHRVVVPAKESDEHRFVMRLKIKNLCQDISKCTPVWEDEADVIEDLLDVDDVITMEVESLDGQTGDAIVLYHVIAPIIESNYCDETDCDIFHTFYKLSISFNLTFTSSEKYIFLYLGSTMYCLPPNDKSESSLHWETTRIGEKTAPKEFCMQSNGLPVTRKCSGSFLHGGKWDSVIGSCSSNYAATNRTTFLYSLAKGRADAERAASFLTHDMVDLLNDKEDMIPADVYFLSLSLKMIFEMSEQNGSNIDLGDSNNIAMAVDSIMQIDESCLYLAQTMNSSNVMLESLNQILSKISQNESALLLDDENGIDLALTPLYLIQISNPAINNVTGLALVRKEGVNSINFTDMVIVPLTSNMTVDQIIAIEGLEVATWIPQDLWELIANASQIENGTEYNRTAPNIIVDIFNNAIVFQETKSTKSVINSRVISISIPGRESDLPLPLPLIYKRFDGNATSKRDCVYWDLISHHPQSMGSWSRTGCYFVASYRDLDVCACVHLTHFAQLVMGYRGGGDNAAEVIIYQYHGRALNTITLIGCSLSLMGVAGIAATAILFRSWRQKAGTKVLLQLSGAIALQMIMMVTQDGGYVSQLHCLILGALLHYTVLAAFMWMLLTALLQFARYVKVLGQQRPVRFMVKFSLIGWGLPLIPVGILMLVDHTAYFPPLPSGPPVTSRDPAALCYPQGLGLYLSVILPVACIVVTNLIVFVLVLRAIMVGPDGKRRAADPELVISQLRLSILLFFLLGLSWIFGLLAVTSGSILFSYLFCITATLQGFVLFVYFVICDPATRVLWVSLVREKSRSSSSKELSG